MVEVLLPAEASLSRTGPAVVPVVYVLPSDAPPDPWAGIDVIDPTDANASSPSLLTGAGIEAAPPVAAAVSPATRAPAARKTSFPWLLIGSVFGLLAAVALAGIIVIKIRNKDGTETEIKVPEGSTVEVTKDGKTLGVFPKKDDPTAKKEPPVGVVAGSPWTRVPVGQSPLDKLDPKEIPAEERFDYQPKELVAVIGTHARRMWWTVSAVAVSPDGKLAAISKRSGEVMLWDVATQKPKWPAPMTLGGNMLDFTPDSGRLIVGTSAATAGISVIDVTAAVPSLEQWRTGEKPGAVIEVKGTVVWVLEGGRTLLVRADDLKEQQSRFTLVDISGATSRHTEGELLNHLFWNIVAPTSNEVVYVAVDGKLRRATIKNAKIESDEELPIKVDEKERPRAISPDGKRLALWGGDHLQLWDLGQKPAKLLSTMKPGAGPHSVLRFDAGCVLSPDGRWLAAWYNGTVLFRIDGPEPKFAGSLDQTGVGQAGSIAFSQDGNRAVIGNSEGFVRFWDLSGAEPKELSPFDPDTAFRIHPAFGTAIDARTGRLMLSRYDRVGRYQL